jgi:hypothetical protein
VSKGNHERLCTEDVDCKSTQNTQGGGGCLDQLVAASHNNSMVTRVDRHEQIALGHTEPHEHGCVSAGAEIFAQTSITMHQIRTHYMHMRDHAYLHHAWAHAHKSIPQNI